MIKQLIQHLKEIDTVPHRTYSAWWIYMELAVHQFNEQHGTLFDPTDAINQYMSGT